MNTLFLFFKAKRPRMNDVMDDLFGDGPTGDLFDKPILHQGHTTKTGAYVAPFIEHHKVRVETPEPAAPPAAPPDPRGLDQAATYEASPELAALARRLAKDNYDVLGRPRGIGLGDLKREFTAGKHADVVGAALDAEDAAKAKVAKKAAKGREDAAALTAPPGYALTAEGDKLRLKGPFDEDLHARIKRAGGEWDGVTGRNSKTWLIPAEKGSSLKRIFANRAPAAPPAPPAEDPAAAAQKAAKLARVTLERWIGFVENSAGEGRIYQKGIEKLREFGVGNHSDLKARMDAAVAKAKAVQAKVEADKVAAKQARAAEEAEQGKTYLNVPYEEKDRAKRYGARWDPDRRRWYVVGNVPAELALYSAEPKALPEGHFHVQQGSGYGGRPFNVGQVFKNPRGDGYVVVVRAGKRYFREDGMSFGVGDDEGWIYSAVVRPATPEEAAPEVAKAKTQEAKVNARASVSALAKMAREKGEIPPGPVVPEGETILDTENAYGGGDWWVIGPDAIWYVQNNGADGDNWSSNNVRTGGAGAIGWKLPYDAVLEATLRQSADLLSKSLRMPHVFPAG